MSFYLVYISRASKPMSTTGLTTMLHQLSAKHLSLNTTGMLIYMEARFIDKLEGRFMQFIEGKQDDVMYIYNEINSDPELGATLVLASGKQPQRLFTEWSMSFNCSHQQIDQANYKALNEELFEAPFFPTLQNQALFLKNFYDFNTELQSSTQQQLPQTEEIVGV